MPINHATAPPEAEEILREHLPAVLTGPGAHRHGSRPIDLADVHVSDPHRGFHVGLDDLRARNDPLEKAQFVAYRYFIYDDEDIIGVAQLSVRRGALRWAGFSSGPSVNAKVKALIAAEQVIDESGDRERVDFEFRGLHIPAVRFPAIWLVAQPEDQPTRSFIIPIHDHPSGLKTRQMYAWTEVWEALQEAADDALEFDRASMERPPR